MDKIIESKQNSKVKLIARLEQKKYRDQEGLFLIEGIRSIKHALNFDVAIALLVFDESAIKSNPRLQQLFDQEQTLVQDKVIFKSSIFKELSDTIHSQGVMGLVKKRKFDLQQLLQQGERLLLVDEVQDPGNLGTLIRTADAAGFDGLLCTKGTTDAYSPKVNRSAMGSNLYLPIHYITEEEIELFLVNDFQLWVTLLDENARAYNDISYGRKAIVAVGNEGKGVSKTIAGKGKGVYIPIYGKAESLNVAAAASVVMYQSVMEK